ncbi:MAG: bifunctional phosphopantothenoylcysteine decarboxylase/phosphopantothenate--cysteine ligase CoaBC [Acidobacteriota bacterium]|nr:MAG: bifunctional phosphopantothenoylcysteine decarboxylase/phosphopantothenate--cysteine ligase CoaBC [Acidobacteriota bacterium]
MKVVLGVTGCIGAYKSALVLRLLQQHGIEIIPVMTESATQFLGPLTLEKLSGNRVITGLFDDRSAEIEHISVARSSQLLLVAPATANILAKFASGIADDFLSTLYLSTTTPVMVAPAMNVEMWNHPATRRNLEILKERGVLVVEPESGYQACGEEGPGRLAEPEVIVRAALAVLQPAGSLSGKQVLVTAGPTIEDIDPVRYISNRSSGKMGYAVAAEAAARGARVVLISGPTNLAPPGGVETVQVRSAAEMNEAVEARWERMDVVVKAAAVADHTPAQVSPQKIKKKESSQSIELVPTVDILKSLGKRKTSQLLVGFAAESERVVENARLKCQSKGLDLIVANDISGPEAGFRSDQNEVVLIDRTGHAEFLPKMSKADVAARIWDAIEALLKPVEVGSLGTHR